MAGLGKCADRARSRPLRQALRPLRRAGGRRRPRGPGRGAGRRPRRRARDPGGRAERARRLAALRSPGDDRRQAGRAVGRRRRSAELRAHAGRARCCRARTAFGYYDHNMVSLMRAGRPIISSDLARALSQPRQRLWRVRAKHVVLATGAIERPLLRDNDRPGCMLASAAQTYVNRYGVRAGQARGRLHQQRHRLSGRARPGRMPASRSPPWSTCARIPTASWSRPRARAASRSSPAMPSPASRASWR